MKILIEIIKAAAPGIIVGIVMYYWNRKQNRKSAPVFVFEDNGRAEMCQFPNVSF